LEISASLVKDLREKTGVGMMDCKKALRSGATQAAIIPSEKRDRNRQEKGGQGSFGRAGTVLYSWGREDRCACGSEL
jgi:elongation factor Ts